MFEGSIRDLRSSGKKEALEVLVVKMKRILLERYFMFCRIRREVGKKIKDFRVEV